MTYNQLSRKQQFQTAEVNRKMLVKMLYELLDAVQNSPAKRRYSSFPFGQMEKGIQKMLDVIERKWLWKIWAKQKMKRESR